MLLAWRVFFLPTFRCYKFLRRCFTNAFNAFDIVSTSRSSPFSIYFSRISAIRELCISIYAQRVKTRNVNNKVGGVLVTSSLCRLRNSTWGKNNWWRHMVVLESVIIMIAGTGISPQLLSRSKISLKAMSISLTLRRQ